MLINLFKKKLPEALPADLQQVVDRLRQAKSKEDCLKEAYSLLSTKYRGYRFKTYLSIFSLLTNTLEKIWNKSGFFSIARV